VAQFTVRKC